jgi:hypothetical protein
MAPGKLLHLFQGLASPSTALVTMVVVLSSWGCVELHHHRC